MTNTLLIFGDSNTHGSPPMDPSGAYARYGPDIRWPNVTATALGSGWEVIAEGLPGRTTQFDDPVMGAHMNGQTGLRIALESHGPLDLVTIMLGTNDTKTRFSPTPERITAGLAGLLDIAFSDEMQLRHGGFRVLVICPPPVVHVSPSGDEFIGAEGVSRALAPVLQAHSERRGAAFFDASSVIEVSRRDGIHFEPDAHLALGRAVADAILAL